MKPYNPGTTANFIGNFREDEFVAYGTTVDIYQNLQSSFDYSQIKYTEDYYDNDMTSEAELVAPEWKVYFDGDFWGHRGKDRAGKEIKLDKQFDWAGYHWVIPAAYSCSKGLVVDFLYAS